MVEFGGPPGERGVAARASLLVLAGCELAGMHVRVATAAILCGAAEGNRPRGLFHRRLVTRQTIHCGVAPQQ